MCLSCVYWMWPWNTLFVLCLWPIVLKWLYTLYMFTLPSFLLIHHSFILNYTFSFHHCHQFTLQQWCVVQAYCPLFSSASRSPVHPSIRPSTCFIVGLFYLFRLVYVTYSYPSLLWSNPLFPLFMNRLTRMIHSSVPHARTHSLTRAFNFESESVQAHGYVLRSLIHGTQYLETILNVLINHHLVR